MYTDCTTCSSDHDRHGLKYAFPLCLSSTHKTIYRVIGFKKLEIAVSWNCRLNAFFNQASMESSDVRNRDVPKVEAYPFTMTAGMSSQTKEQFRQQFRQDGGFDIPPMPCLAECSADKSFPDPLEMFKSDPDEDGMLACETGCLALDSVDDVKVEKPVDLCDSKTDTCTVAGSLSLQRLDEEHLLSDSDVHDFTEDAVSGEENETGDTQVSVGDKVTSKMAVASTGCCHGNDDIGSRRKSSDTISYSATANKAAPHSAESAQPADHQHVVTASQNPFMCNACGACFTNDCNLRKHLESHANIKLYKCRICSAIFNWSAVLKKHLKSHSSQLHLQKRRNLQETYHM